MPQPTSTYSKLTAQRQDFETQELYSKFKHILPWLLRHMQDNSQGYFSRNSEGSKLKSFSKCLMWELIQKQNI